jgi:hypothetical protein
MADWCGVMGKGSGRVGGYGTRRSMRDEDFEEQEVWSVMKEIGDSSSNSKYPSSGSSSSSSSSAWHIPTAAPRTIPSTKPTPTNHGGKVVQQQSSAPVNIPDWSKIYGKNSRNMGSWADHNGIAYDDGDYHVNDDEGGDDDIVPPHEWLARKLARSQISSFSVCEGIGRTLKGRDLSKVRNAILTKTGFLE